jgi:hypothetical protein
MGEGRVSLTPCADFYRPVEELEYTDLLRSTFTQSDHERDVKTWRTPATHPQCAFCGKKYRWGKGEVECHMDPTITKASTEKERFMPTCAESQSTSRDPNRTRFLTVQTTIRVKTQCDKKCLLAAADASEKRIQMVVGGHADNAVDMCAADNADAKCQYLGKGQTTFATDKQFCRRKMDEGIKKDLWSVIEDFSKAPGGKDFNKMKAQYTMFVDDVTVC